MSNNFINSRVQLKMDTEANWITHASFVPLAGEVVIYSADATHSYPRIKVGNGVNTIGTLPFIDANTINGVDSNNIVAKSLQHSLTFGANGNYTFDGSQNVTVPVYTGAAV